MNSPLPCPCCGYAAGLFGGPEYYIICDVCSLQTQSYPNPQAALTAWNKRTHWVIQLPKEPTQEHDDDFVGE